MRLAQLDGFRGMIDDWWNRTGTEAGQNLAAGADEWFSKNGLQGRYRAIVNKWMERYMKKANFAELIGKLRAVGEQATAKALEGSGELTKMAQEAHDKAIPIKLAGALGEEVAGALRLAGEGTGMSPDWLKAFENSIKSKIRDQFPKIDRS